MAESKIFLGKPRSGMGVTVQFAEIKTSLEQMKQAYRNITDEDIKEMKSKAIGNLFK